MEATKTSILYLGRVLFFGMFIVLSIPMCSQGFPYIHETTGQQNEVNDMIEIEPGVFVGVGWQQTNESSPIDYVSMYFRLNDQGILLDSHILDMAEGHEAYSVVRSETDGLYIAGSDRSGFLNDTIYPVVYKTTASGEVLWMQTYPYATFFDIDDILPMPDGGFLLSATDYDPLFDRNVLIRCDEQGDTLWTKAYYEPQKEFAARLRLSADGNVLIIGIANSGGFADSQGLIRKVDLQGETIWRRIIDVESGSLLVNDGIEVDNEVVITGILKVDGEDDQGYIGRVDDQGEVIWSELYGGELNDRFYSIDIDSQGRLIVTGSTRSFDAEEDDCYSVVVSTDGDLISQFHFGGMDDESLIHSLITEDDRILHFGFTRSYSEDGRRSYVALTGVDGVMVTDITEREQDLFANGIEVYPNPVRKGDQCTVEIHTESFNSGYQFKLHDVYGKSISNVDLKPTFSESTLSIDTHRLAVGLYVMSYMSEGQRFLGRLIVR